MNLGKQRKRILCVGIVVIPIFIGGTYSSISTILISSAQAQTPSALGDPFFVEEGTITNQREIGPNRIQLTISTNGTINSDIEVTNTGYITTIFKGDNLAFDQGQGVVSTKDGAEAANYTLIGISQEGKFRFRGAVVYSTNSTGELSFLNNMVGIYNGTGNSETGNFESREWEWK